MEEILELIFDDVRPRLKVTDNKGNTGAITSAEHDIHNVEVKYLKGGKGFYCFDRTCAEYDPLFVYI